MEFALTVNTPFNGIGILCGTNNTGIHAVELYDRTTETLLRSVNVDLTGKAAGTFYYANMTPITLVAGHQIRPPDESDGGRRPDTGQMSAPRP